MKRLLLAFLLLPIICFAQSSGNVRTSIFGNGIWNTGTWTGTGVPFISSSTSGTVRSVSGTGSIVASSGTFTNGTISGSTTFTGIQTGGEDFYSTRLFVADGTYFYRIPSIIKLANGTLVAACEARSGGSDDSQAGIATSRSVDNGRTWTPIEQTIPYASGTCTQNPTFCQTPGGTRLFLITMKHNIADTRAILRSGTGGMARLFSQYSDDSAVTWSAPVEISNLTGGGYNMQNVGTGQGVVSTLTNRMLVPRWRIPNGGATTDAVCGVIYSDDNGATWAYTEAGSGLEASVTSRGSGRIRLNVRQAASGVFVRRIYLSTNEAASFDSGTNDPQLPDPNNSASEISFTGTNARLLFCNTANTQARINFGLRSSQDPWPNTNWTGPEIFDAGGGSGYSMLAQLSSSTVGCLYEGGTEPGYNITFVALNAISQSETDPYGSITMGSNSSITIGHVYRNLDGSVGVQFDSGASGPSFTIINSGTSGGTVINMTGTQSVTFQNNGTNTLVLHPTGTITAARATGTGTNQIANIGTLNGLFVGSVSPAITGTMTAEVIDATDPSTGHAVQGTSVNNALVGRLSNVASGVQKYPLQLRVSGTGAPGTFSTFMEVGPTANSSGVATDVHVKLGSSVATYNIGFNSAFGYEFRTTQVDCPGDVKSSGGNFNAAAVGKTLLVSSSTNGLAGTITLSSGAGVIVSTALTTNCTIIPSLVTPSGAATAPVIQVFSGSAVWTGAVTDNGTWNWVAVKRN